MENDASLMIYSAENCTSDLSFNAISFYHPRTLKIFVNDQPHIWAEIPIGSFVNVNSPAISLKEGGNVIRFHIPEGCERPCDLKNSNTKDDRCLSIAIQNITFSQNYI